MPVIGLLDSRARGDSYVRFGSKADISLSPADVRFTSKSRHRWPRVSCSLIAKLQTLCSNLCAKPVGSRTV
jgi:hypothetical protein